MSINYKNLKTSRHSEPSKEVLKYFYVSFDSTGKITKISSTSSNENNEIYTNDININKISKDSLSIDSVYIYKNEVFLKDGTICFPDPENKFTKIPEIDNANITLTLFKKNKLLQIDINYSAVRTWYNRKMKFFNFKDNDLIFKIISKGKTKEFKVPLKKFGNTFSTIIKLPEIEDINDVIFKTKKITETYNLKILDERYLKKENKNIEFTSSSSKNPDIEVQQKGKILNVNIKNNNILEKSEYNNIEFYITSLNKNKIYDKIILKTNDIEKNKKFSFKINYQLHNKQIFCDKDISVKLKIPKKKRILPDVNIERSVILYSKKSNSIPKNIFSIEKTNIIKKQDKYISIKNNILTSNIKTDLNIYCFDNLSNPMHSISIPFSKLKSLDKIIVPNINLSGNLVCNKDISVKLKIPKKKRILPDVNIERSVILYPKHIQKSNNNFKKIDGIFNSNNLNFKDINNFEKEVNLYITNLSNSEIYQKITLPKVSKINLQNIKVILNENLPKYVKLFKQRK